ncbi:MAG: hypothetical protein ISS49_17685 [Anaerolineae bacterium]|nr:hypothetical protein [Anaerolineae bacterium]
MAPVTIKRHVLPGEEGGDTAWFYRQNSFEQQEIFRQVAFKRRRWPQLGDGSASKRPAYTYPHILPTDHKRLTFHEPLADAILSYLIEEDIALHSEVLNLKSSQAACLNFLFPLRQNLNMAKAALQRFPFLPGLREVTGIEFEYTGPPGATEWLGEPRRGKRGQNRTSIDAAIFWIGRSKRKCITLVEWKYTESNFGACSAFHSASKDDKAKCRALDVARDVDPARSCLLTTGGDRRSRRYWEHVEAAGISLSAFASVQGCPFQDPFYQLMRQFLLAAYLRQTGEADEVEVVSIGFARNTKLHIVPPQLRSLVDGEKEGIVSAWNAVLKGVPPMRHWTVEQLMARVNKIEGIDLGWRNYLRERYDV